MRRIKSLILKVTMSAAAFSVFMAAGGGLSNNHSLAFADSVFCESSFGKGQRDSKGPAQEGKKGVVQTTLNKIEGSETNVGKTIHFTGDSAGSTVKCSTYNTAFVCSSSVIRYPRSSYLSEYKTESVPDGMFTALEQTYSPINAGYSVHYEVGEKSGYCKIGETNTYYTYTCSEVSTLVVQSNKPSEMLTINLNAPFLHGGKTYNCESSGNSFTHTRTDIKFIGRFRFILSPISSTSYPPFIFTPGALYVSTFGENSSVYIETLNNDSISNNYTSVIMCSGGRFDGGGTFYVNNLNQDLNSVIESNLPTPSMYGGDQFSKCFLIESPLYLISANEGGFLIRTNALSIFYLGENESALLYAGHSTQSNSNEVIQTNYSRALDAFGANTMIGSATLSPSSSSDFESVYPYKDSSLMKCTIKGSTTEKTITQAILLAYSDNPDLVYFDRASGVTGELPPALKLNNLVSFLRGGEYTSLSGCTSIGWYKDSESRTSANLVIPGTTDLSGISILYSGFDCVYDFRINKLFMNMTVDGLCLSAMPDVVSFLNYYSSASGTTYAGWRDVFLGGADLDEQDDSEAYALYPEHVKRLIQWGRNTGYAVQKDSSEGFVLTDISSVSTVIANSSIGHNVIPIAVVLATVIGMLAASFIVIATISKRRNNNQH